MKKICIYFFLLMSVNVVGQNLVPNWSFEDTIACPTHEDQIQRAIGWSKYSEAVTTPDYFNACAPVGSFSVPDGGAGVFYQDAHTGNALAGIVIFWPNNYREHIGVQLTQQLVIGLKYFISFYVNLGQVYGTSCPSNKMGIRLSTIPYDGSNPAPIDNFAHVYSNMIINDSVNWVKIAGSVIADSAYNFLIVGNFFDNMHTDTMRYNSNTGQSYYLIDDVCISTDSLTCNPSSGEGINENIIRDAIQISPNPAHDYIEISGNEIQSLMLYDAFGRAVFSRETKFVSPLHINCSSFRGGVYFLRAATEDGVINRKVVVEKEE